MRTGHHRPIRNKGEIIVVVNNCPFCRPSSDDVIIAETPHAIAICDARPLCAGHVLICPKNHFESMIDAPVWALNHVAALQYEIGCRILHQFGEVGIYEHGRSSLWRFRTAPLDFRHAHVHALPVSDDVLRFAESRQSWCSMPAERDLHGERDYFYQECSGTPLRKWAVSIAPSRSHCVRGLIEKALEVRHSPSIPLAAAAAEHEGAIEQTVKALRSGLLPPLHSLALAGIDKAVLREVADELQDRLGWPIVEQDDPRQPPTTAIESMKDHQPMIVVSDGLSSARPPIALNVVLGDATVLNRVMSWELLRLISTGVPPKALADVILTTFELRNGWLSERHSRISSPYVESIVG